MPVRQSSIVIADNLPFGLFGSNSTDYGLSTMMHVLDADKVAFRVTGTFNQAVDIQVVAGDQNMPRDLDQLVSIDAAVSLPVGSTTTAIIGLTLNLNDNWWPWVGLMLTTGATAPTAGRVTAVAVARFLPGNDEIMDRLDRFIDIDRQILDELRGHRETERRPGSPVQPSNPIWPFLSGR